MFESIKGYLSVLTQESVPAEDPVVKPPAAASECETNESGLVTTHSFSSFEDLIKDRLFLAKHWTSQIYASMKSSENPAQVITSQVQNQLVKMNVQSIISKVPLFREFQKSQAEFEAERCQKHPELSEPTSPSDANCLPWHPDTSGITDPAAVADLRARILALSQYPNTFLLAPPAEAQLGSTSTLSAEQWLLAKLLLEEDPKLAEMRYNLVPSRISEDLFWRNYFYRMTLLRQSAHLAAATGADTQPEMNSDSGNFVYIEENDQQPSHESDQLGASEADTKSAKNEHKTSKRRGKNKNHSSEKVKPTTEAAETEAKNDTQVDEKTDKILSVDELLDAELAREVDELVLVSSDDPLNDELDRELEMELAQIDRKK